MNSFETESTLIEREIKGLSETAAEERRHTQTVRARIEQVRMLHCAIF